MTVPAAIPSHFHVAWRVSHPHFAPRSVRSCAASAPSPTHLLTHSTLDKLPSTSTPRKKRSRRCFVCGGTGKHRLHPRFCPRTAELFAKGLVMFDFTFRLVSFDGSPLPMTRHPGGVAAHLLSPRRLSARPVHVSSHQNSTSPCTCNSNAPHVAAPTPIRPRTIEPNVDSNRPHTSHATTVPRRVVNPTVDLDSLHAPRPSVVHPHTIYSQSVAANQLYRTFHPSNAFLHLPFTYLFVFPFLI
ncbi:hypothetical protein B0H13DRAFT_1067077 [Mycena leptocephala]|nr:hypothetical protein B0H13DRAFT_1067077 [Mycena leptocephala]